jgi:hypothetical protein
VFSGLCCGAFVDVGLAAAAGGEAGIRAAVLAESGWGGSAGRTAGKIASISESIADSMRSVCPETS